MTPLNGRRALVTGGASGIGAATVRALAAAGADVTIATRDPRRADALRADNVHVRALDLADLDSVAGFTWDGPLDVLVANAGVMALPTRRLSPQGWELQLATNYLGHFALALGLHPNLAAAGDARLVVVGSGAYRNGPFDFDDPQFARRRYEPFLAYAQSKTATLLFTVGAADRWAADGIVANAVNPGYVHTELQRHLDDDTMRAFGAMDEAGHLLTPDYYKTPAEAAATSVRLAAATTTGGYYEDGRKVEPEPFATDPAAEARLWRLGEETVRGAR
ncbi:SDR family NAD(P)-dependent oxidoreductase [Cryptosporangium japonicum]|uniref:SDR family NAD(P)-dependent oxidoreductase n=1 Tax=Cryptosporangium japonicum TaxID=80872 RepID=A0ABN0TMG1_9ACTN